MYFNRGNFQNLVGALESSHGEGPGPLTKISPSPCVMPSYTPRFNEVERGVYWFHLVRLSVCGQNRVRSVSSTILVLIGSISYFPI